MGKSLVAIKDKLYFSHSFEKFSGRSSGDRLARRADAVGLVDFIT